MKAIVALASFVIIVAGMKMASNIIVPLLLATFIAIVSSPSLLYLQKKGIHKILAFLLILGLVIVVLSTVGYIVTNAMNSFIDKLPDLQTKLEASTKHLLEILHSWDIHIPKEVPFPNELDPSKALATIGGFLHSMTKFLSNSFLIFLMTSFILFEQSVFDEKGKYLYSLSPTNKTMIDDFLLNIKQYLAIKTLSSLATGVIIGVLLWIMNIEYAMLWGLLAFLLNYIPTIGSVLAAIPAMLVTIIEASLMDTLFVGLIFLGVNIVIGNIIEPRFLGKGLGISTLVVLVSLLFWGYVFGAIGLFLAIPLTMSLKIALYVNPSTRWMSVMLSNKIE